MKSSLWQSGMGGFLYKQKELFAMPDPVTHTCLSLVLARHLFREHKGLFVLAGMSPDLDVAIGGVYLLLTRPLPSSIYDFTQESLIFHPSLTAAIWFLPIYAILLSWVFRRFNQRAQTAAFRQIYTIVLCGMLFHIGLDLLQTGNRPFWPLAWEAGLGILPYTTAGFLWPLAGSIALLIADLAASYFLPAFRREKTNY